VSTAWSRPGRVHVEPDFISHFDYVTKSGTTVRQYTFSAPLGDQVVRLSEEHLSCHAQAERVGADRMRFRPRRNNAAP
jgi:hypothetical protein